MFTMDNILRGRTCLAKINSVTKIQVKLIIGVIFPGRHKGIVQYGYTILKPETSFMNVRLLLILYIRMKMKY